MTEVAALGLRVDGVADIDRASSSLDRFTKSSKSADQASGSLSTESRNTSKSLADVAREGDRTSTSISKLAGAAKLAAGALAGIKLTGLIKDITMANSRFEQLGLVMGVVGRNAGLSQQQVGQYAKEVQAMGISMTESRQTVIRMAQAQMDLSRASELARLAQDAAVIANTNSSEALGRLIYGLQSGQVEILRNMGLNVNFAASYSKLAAEMGVTTDQLSEVDKVQARTNAVMEAGIGIAGAYEASMENAGKQLGSTTRYLQDLGVMWGEVFSEAAREAIFGYSDALKGVHATTQRMSEDGTLESISKAIGSLARGLVTAAKVAGTFAIAMYAIPALQGAWSLALAAKTTALKLFTAQVVTATGALGLMQRSLMVVAAAFAGWQIGTYLRNEFEIVEKAGIALMGGLHQMAIHLGGYFERMGESINFALTNPLDAFRNKLADLLQSLTGLGQGALRALGLDGFADAIGSGIEKIRSKTGEEHRAMLEQMKKDTQREADAVSDIYAEMFANVGKSAGANLKTAGKALDDVLDRLGGFNDELKNTGGNTRGIKEVDTAFQSLYDSLFPAEAAQRKYNEQIALLKKHLSGDRLAKAIDRLNDSLADGDHTGPADAIAAYVEELQNLEDKINPAGRAAREFAEEQAKLRAEIERSGDPTGKWTRLLEENERQMRENTRVTNQWTEWTESALERVDSAFANAWRNIGDGFSSFRDDLVNAFKQMLAELAHLAITRPIVLQIGAAMGIGGVSGSAFAGAGGGGGLDLISLARMGYQAYQGVTGTGLIGSIATGFKTGGLSGAWSGATGWAGGAASGLNAAAGQMYGVVTQGGAGLTTYAPLTYQLGGVSNTVTAIAPWASGIGGAYMGWQQAGAKGAVAGGLGGFGGAKAGAALGSFAGPIGTAVGAAIGGILGSIGGASLFGSGEKYKRTVGSATGSYSDGQYTSGGQSQTWFAGYHRTFGDEFNQSLDDLNRQFSSLLGGLFDAFDIDSTIETEARTRQRRTSGRLATDFLVAIDGEMSAHLRQYGGKGDVGKAMEEFADDIMGEYLAKSIVGSSLPEYFRQQFEPLAADSKVTAEQVAETLTGIFTRFDGVNSVLELTRLAAFELTDAGMRASDAIIALSGGLDALQASTSVYYDQFFTAAEKQADTISAVEKAFEAANITLAESREGYRAMVEDIDVTTEAGQQMFATMMSLSGMAAEYYSILEQRAAEATSRLLANTRLYYEQFTSESQKTEDALAGIVAQFAELELALPGTRAGFIAVVDALDTSTEAGQRMFETLMSVAGAADAYYDVLEQRASQAVTSAYSLLERSINAEKAALTEAYKQRKAGYEAEMNARRQSQQQAAQARSASYRDMVQTAAATASALSRLGGSISSALSGLLEDVPGMLEQRRSSAVAQIRRALETGNLSDTDALAAAAQRAAAVDSGVFATLEDYRREQGRTASLLGDLGDLTAARQTAAERQAESLQALAEQSAATAQALGQSISGVRTSIDVAYEAEMAALDEQLELAKSQIDALNGIDSSVVSVADAVEGLSAAIRDAMSIIPGLASIGIPAFASGGVHTGGLRLVGENGPELEVTGPSRIYSAGQTARMLGGAETAAAIRRLEQTVARQGDALRAIAKHTMRSARNTEVLERWDYDGLPEERALA